MSLMPGPLRRALACAVLGAVAALALSGCVKVAYALRVDGGNDTVSGSVVVAFSRAALTADGRSEAEAYAQARAEEGADATGIPGARSEHYEDADYYGDRYVFEDVSFGAFSASDAGRNLTFTHRDGRISFDAVVDNSRLRGLPSALAATIRYSVTVAFPGAVEESNGRTLDDRTVAWDVDVTGRAEMHAVAADGASGPMWMIIGGAAAVLVLGAAAALIALRVRRTRAAPHAPSGAVPPAPHAPSGAVPLAPHAPFGAVPPGAPVTNLSPGPLEPTYCPPADPGPHNAPPPPPTK